MLRKYEDEIRIITVDALACVGNLENFKNIENRGNYTFIKIDITDKQSKTYLQSALSLKMEHEECDQR